MVDPLIALLSGIGVLILFGLIFWPQSGLYWRFQKRGILTEKVLIEVALKYIWCALYQFGESIRDPGHHPGTGIIRDDGKSVPSN